MIFLVIHFNTPELTEALIRSVYKYNTCATIVMIDNSSSRKFPKHLIDELFIHYIDNTQNNIINFDYTFSMIKLPIDETCLKINNLGSARHALTIDWAIWNLPYDNFILLDSDILLTRNIDFVDATKITVGTKSSKEMAVYPDRHPRMLPYCQFLNARLIKHFKIHYFDPTRILGFYVDKRKWDTGASFYQDVLSLNKRLYNDTIDIDNYMVHYKGASWRPSMSYNDFLTKYRRLWSLG